MAQKNISPHMLTAVTAIGYKNPLTQLVGF